MTAAAVATLDHVDDPMAVPVDEHGHERRRVRDRDGLITVSSSPNAPR